MSISWRRRPLNPSSPNRRLRQIRFERGKDQQVVADLAGISRSYLSMLESGERSLDRRSLVAALAQALDVAPQEIVSSEVWNTAKPPRFELGPSDQSVRLECDFDERDGGTIVLRLRDRARIDAKLLQAINDVLDVG